MQHQRAQTSRSSPVAVAASSQENHTSSRRTVLGQLLSAPLLATALLNPQSAQAIQPAPQGFRLQNDKLDGYSFVYPEVWTQVTTSGNDYFIRNAYDSEENMFVDITSPSSSRFTSVSDLGTPDDAAKRILDQYLNREFMSTRLGIRRDGEIMGASQRTGADGKLYYDIDIRMASFASRNPYTSVPAEVQAEYGVEWDRRYVTVLGVANQRLYEMRLQTSSRKYETSLPVLRGIMDSFAVREVDI
ncbi:MAG: hypothetical protein WDW38_008296 [Sanguina aurantia]